ncbi:MAG: MBL fold metallo-hydrolase [Promethearchaeota archaeon]|jgi:7,8-dihydropterin-6-yl-methyl-4-(beta-D-ribofuranosyl)aminobenzene 5'-phosphate synthase
MKSDISNGIESGNLTVKVLATNTVDLTLLTEEKFKGKVIQPGAKAIRTTGEHGLALSVEIKEDDQTHHILLDSGNLTSTIIENSKSCKVNLNKIEKLILSHGHFDHFGALMKIIPELKEGCEIILNPECYFQSHSFVFSRGKVISNAELGTSWKKLMNEGKIKLHKKFPILNRDLLHRIAEQHRLKIIETKNPYLLVNGAITSGVITLFDSSEITRGLYIEPQKNEFDNYLARDETSIYLNVKDKGLGILTGCGHAGIINTIKHAQELTGIQEIYAIIGGLHKVNQPTKLVDDTIKFIEGLNPEITCGMHCTGFEFNKRMSIGGHPSHTLGVVGTEFHL